jgi:hypothetical protein
MIPTIEDQTRAFTSWQQGSPKLPKSLIDVLDRIKTHGEILNSALMSLQLVYDGLSHDRRHSDDVVANLEKNLSMDLFEEVEGAKDVFVAINATCSELSTAETNVTFVKFWRSPKKGLVESLNSNCNQLDRPFKAYSSDGPEAAEHLRHTGTKDECIVSDIFLKEYDGLERMHSKEVLERLRLRFSQEPFAVTVSLDPEREQSEEEGRDHADMIYDFLDEEEKVETFLQQFKNMGSKWAAAMLGDSPMPEMRTLEKAHTTLSCGVISALKKSVPRDEGICQLKDDTDYLQCRLERWEELTNHQKIVIAVGGHFSHGKSSFLNALMGEDVLPTNSESNQHGEIEANIKHPRVIHNCDTLPYSTQIWR